MKWFLPALLALMLVPSAGWAAAPVFSVLPTGSTVTFKVKASVPIQGRFDKWTARLTFTSPDVSTGVLEIKIDAGSVHTGSGLKDGTLKSSAWFDVKNNPFIVFRSTKVSQTGPDTFAVNGNLTIRGVSRPETLVLKTTGRGTGSGAIDGTMAFDRKAFGMTSNIPLVRIDDRVDVIAHLKVKRVSGPPPTSKP
jgi:polyisoprenoid-binding protein YceI